MESLKNLPIIVRFCDQLVTKRGSSPSTRRCYQTDLSHLAGFIANKHKLTVNFSAEEDELNKLIEMTEMPRASTTITRAMIDADAEFLRDFFNQLETNHYSVSSTLRMIACLRSFYKWANSFRSSNSDPMREIRGPRKIRSIPRILSIEDIERVIDTPNNSKTLGLRDQAMIGTLFATSMRVGELVNINVDDLGLSDTKSWIKIRNSDHKKEDRVVTLDDHTVCSIKHFMDHVKNDPRFCEIWNGKTPRPLFFNKFGQRINQRSVRRLLRKHSHSAGFVPAINPNTIRHSSAIHLLKGGIDKDEMQRLLGLSSRTTIDVYSRTLKNLELATTAK